MANESNFEKILEKYVHQLTVEITRINEQLKDMNGKLETVHEHKIEINNLKENKTQLFLMVNEHTVKHGNHEAKFSEIKGSMKAANFIFGLLLSLIGLIIAYIQIGK